MMGNESMQRGAAISACGAYRYHLWREWDRTQPRMLLIMLNPSTADDAKDDHTTTKSIAIARYLGFSRLDVGNLQPASLRHLTLSFVHIFCGQDCVQRQMPAGNSLIPHGNSRMHIF
jgi:hypothetical protein